MYARKHGDSTKMLCLNHWQLHESGSLLQQWKKNNKDFSTENVFAPVQRISGVCMLPRTEPRSGAFSLNHSFSPFHKLEKISVKEPSLVRNLKKKAAYTIHLITFYVYNLYLLLNENSFIDFPHYTDNRTLTQEKKTSSKIQSKFIWTITNFTILKQLQLAFWWFYGNWKYILFLNQIIISR